MNKIKKYFIVIMMFIFILICYSPTKALSPVEIGAGSTSIDITEIKNKGNDIFKIVMTVGTVTSVVMLVVLGIKYMLVSIEEKAEYKKTFMAYVVGALLLFASSTIAQVIYDIFSRVRGY